MGQESLVLVNRKGARRPFTGVGSRRSRLPQQSRSAGSHRHLPTGRRIGRHHVARNGWIPTGPAATSTTRVDRNDVDRRHGIGRQSIPTVGQGSRFHSPLAETDGLRRASRDSRRSCGQKETVSSLSTPGEAPLLPLARGLGLRVSPVDCRHEPHSRVHD